MLVFLKIFQSDEVVKGNSKKKGRAAAKVRRFKLKENQIFVSDFEMCFAL